MSKEPKRSKPYTFDEQETLLALIFDRIAEHGEPLSKALKHKGMPGADSFYKWIDGEHNKHRNENYARARKDAA